MSLAASEPFAPVQRESTRHQVYRTLREAILTGRLKTGQRLTEIPLAKEFQVSRAVIREALQQLSHEGLVEQNHYRGSRVIELTPDQIDEIVGVRVLLETEAVRLARQRLTKVKKAELKALAREMSSERDAARFGQLDLQFHQTIWAACGNATMGRLLTQVATPLFAMSLLMRTQEQMRRSQKELRRGDHTPLATAICDGQEAEALAAIRLHLTENWSAIKQRLAAFLAEQKAAS
jgi:DNA-binding GntR family transcriptional regulator